MTLEQKVVLIRTHQFPTSLRSYLVKTQKLVELISKQMQSLKAPRLIREKFALNLSPFKRVFHLTVTPQWTPLLNKPRWAMEFLNGMAVQKVPLVTK